MQKNNVLRSVKYGVLFSILIMILTFLVRKYFIESFGEELTGYYLLINQLIGYLNLAELGLSTASVYLFFKPLNSGDKNEIALFFNVIKRIYKIIAVLIFILGGGIAAILPLLVKENIEWQNIYVPWALFVLSTSLSYLYSAETVLLTADEKLYVVKLITGISRIVCFTIQIIILKTSDSFILFSSIEIVYAVFQLYLFKRYVLKKYDLQLCYNVNTPEITNLIRKSVLSEIKKTFVHKVSGVLIFNTDYVIISVFIGLSTITIYSSYLMFIQATAIILATIVAPLGASIGNILHRTNINTAYSRFNVINCYFFLLATVGGIIYNNTSTDLVQLWMGGNVMFTHDIVTLLAINFFCLVARSAVDIFKVSFGYMSDIHLPIIEGISNLLLSIILVKYYGIKGVIYGTIFSNLLIIMLVRPWYLYINAFKVGTVIFIRDHFRLWLTSLFFSFIVYKGCDRVIFNSINEFITSKYSGYNSFVTLITKQAAFSIVTLIIVFFFYIIIFPELFKHIISFRKKSKNNG